MNYQGQGIQFGNFEEDGLIEISVVQFCRMSQESNCKISVEFRAIACVNLHA